MNTSTPLSTLLATLSAAARARGLTDTEWAARAGLRKETLSRLRRRSSCDFVSLEALAAAIGLQLTLTRGQTTQLTPDGHFPLELNRDYEERLLALCASRTLDPGQWLAEGPAFFMAGLAVMLASVPGFDRKNLLGLAERLHPGSGEPALFARWLERSPVRPARFLPLLQMETRHAA
jgi:hypothetical protein